MLNQTVPEVEKYGEPVYVELKAGEASLHSDLLLHGSEANTRDRRRCGLTLRYTAGDVTGLHGLGGEGRDRRRRTAAALVEPPAPDGGLMAMEMTAPALTGRWVRLEPLAEEHREGLRSAADDDRIWEHLALRVAARFSINGLPRPSLSARLTDDSRSPCVCSRPANSSAARATSTRSPSTSVSRSAGPGIAPITGPTAVNPECKRLLLAHAFDTLGFNRVSFVTDLRNERSQAAIAKLGAIREGVMRSHMITRNGRIRDSVLFAIAAERLAERETAPHRQACQVLERFHLTLRRSPGVSMRLLAEWFATFVLIFGGTGVVVVNKLTDGSVSLVGIAPTWGLLVATMAYAVGPVSGAHMNPAVTLGLAYAGKHPWKDVLSYILAQCAGAFTASLLLAFLTRKASHVGLAPTQPFALLDGAPWVWECFILEVWLTGVLVFVVLSVSTARPEIQSLGGFIAGGVIALEVLFCGPITGASMNPARSLAPAVVGQKMEHLWLYPDRAAVRRDPGRGIVESDPS